LVTAAVDGVSAIILARNKNTQSSFGAWSVLVMGIAQGIAVLPGVSRSGLTIGAGLMMGYEPRDLARFSFYMGLPAIVGAGLVAMPDLVSSGGLMSASTWLAFAAAFLSGLVAIRVLLISVQRNFYPYFAAYCLVLALGVLIT
jgi:undecaprenyl-diphosphatase